MGTPTRSGGQRLAVKSERRLVHSGDESLSISTTNMRELWAQMHLGWGWPEIKDILDVLIVAFLIYELLRLVRGTRAVQVVLGLGLLGLLYEVSSWLEFNTLQWLLRSVVVYAGFAVVVLFQHEIRAVLTNLAKNLRLPFVKREIFDSPFGQDWYDEVVLAATTLASHKTGALIVFERDVSLKTYINSGVPLEARLTYDLLVTMFHTETPLHDGAAIISNDRVAAACCFLPLTQNPYVSRELGTRHRAAIGMTEDSDAFAVVVSEETGVISFVVEGRMERNLTGPELRDLIQQAMEPWRTHAEDAEQKAEDEKLEAVVRANRPAAQREKVREEASL